MKKQLSEVVKRQGIQVLHDPHQLAEELAAEGANKKKVLLLELLLESCPSIYETLVQGEISWPEGTALISSAVRSTAVAPYQVRSILNELFQACGIKLPPVPYGMGFSGKRKVFRGTVSLEEEEKQFRAVWQYLNYHHDHESAALAGLEGMAQAGNAYANYRLGEYYRENHPDDPALALPYYETAAEEGYGPAYGALAYYEMKSKKKNLRKAADYFMYPAALAGKDGRVWAKNAIQLQKYCVENKEHCCLIGKFSVLSLILSILIRILTGSSMAAISILFSAAAVGLSVVNGLVARYHSPRGIYGILLAGWILMALGLLRGGVGA